MADNTSMLLVGATVIVLAFLAWQKTTTITGTGETKQQSVLAEVTNPLTTPIGLAAGISIAAPAVTAALATAPAWTAGAVGGAAAVGAAVSSNPFALPIAVGATGAGIGYLAGDFLRNIFQGQSVTIPFTDLTWTVPTERQKIFGVL